MTKKVVEDNPGKGINNPDVKYYSDEDEVPEFTGGRNQELLKENKKLKFEKVHKSRSWPWFLAAIVVIGFVYHQHNMQVQASKPTCANPQIKGNISYTTGEKIYHLPGDPYYNRTIIDTNQGERMFCTVQEAQAAGWRASGK